VKIKTITLSNVELYNNGVNKASKPAYLKDVPAASRKLPGTVKQDLVYNFADTGKNQNKFENKELRFNLIFTMKAVS
jgi:hypothetical protein